MINVEKEKTIFFTGHRPDVLGITKKDVCARLKKAIDNAIADGFTTFISGMSPGIDRWAAEIVLKKRKKNKNIKLICILPYKDFGYVRSRFQNFRFHRILKKADYVHFTHITLSSDSFIIRDRFMADYSSKLIIAYNGKNGSTKNILPYVTEKKLQIFNILEKN